MISLSARSHIDQRSAKANMIMSLENQKQNSYTEKLKFTKFIQRKSFYFTENNHNHFGLAAIDIRVGWVGL